jgi:hypothetical protein
MTKNPPTDRTSVAQAVATAIAGTAETIMVWPYEIAPSPTNPRKTFPEATLLELGESMAHDGQVQAILLRPITTDAILKWNKDNPDAPEERRINLRYEIVYGERRWRAATLKGLQLRAEVRNLTDLQVVRIQIIENLHREEVHPLEEAEGSRTCCSTSWTSSSNTSCARATTAATSTTSISCTSRRNGSMTRPRRSPRGCRKRCCASSIRRRPCCSPSSAVSTSSARKCGRGGA